MSGHNKQLRGRVFNIQGFSVHDGPGIRSIVFLKGCPLSCRWCANPEGILRHKQFFFRKSACVGVDTCGLCVSICPHKRIGIKQGMPDFSREQCFDCQECGGICPSKAIEVVGEDMTVEQVMNEVLKDGGFYSRSGGGITLSGGEPLLQEEFGAALLKEAKSCGMTTAIETTGYAPWSVAENVFLHVDYIYYDLKSMDEEKHLAYTGVGTWQIKENFKNLCAMFPEKRIIARTPIIPGFNDKPEELEKIKAFILKHKKEADVKHESLPYHVYGKAKYEYLGKAYPMEEEPFLDTYGKSMEKRKEV